MAKQPPSDILCDLCDQGPALRFCNECLDKLDKICLQAHTRQKRTKGHHVIKIKNIKLSLLKVRCSSCENKAEKFCPNCDIRLCVQCAGRHHKLRDTLASTEQLFDTYHSGRLTSLDGSSSENNAIDLTNDDSPVVGKPDTSPRESVKPVSSLDSSSILKQDSTPMPTKVHVKKIAEQQAPDIVCDLCEDEQALSFCDECQNKLCAICLLAHTKQKRTKYHNVTEIVNVELFRLKVRCSFCTNLAKKFYLDCDIRLCFQCANRHHKLRDTLASTEQLFDTYHCVRLTSLNGTSSEDNAIDLTNDDSPVGGKPDTSPQEIVKPVTFPDSSILKQDSTTTLSQVHMKQSAEQQSHRCEDEHALNSCDDRQQRNGNISHLKRKRTTAHHGNKSQPKMHSKKHQCYVCEKSFECKSHLNSHILTHTGERPYSCSYCDATFTQTGHRNEHERKKHSTERAACHQPKNFSCDLCGKEFDEQGLLEHTFKAHPPPTSENESQE